MFHQIAAQSSHGSKLVIHFDQASGGKGGLRQGAHMLSYFQVSLREVIPG